MSVAATISFCDQIGPDDFKMKRHTKIFKNEDTIGSILEWAQQISGFNNKVSINDIEFSKVSE